MMSLVAHGNSDIAGSNNSANSRRNSLSDCNMSPITVSFIYGDIDWMDKSLAKSLVAKFEDEACLRVSYAECVQSGHQVYRIFYIYSKPF